jgi:8-oxo-dGTP pyrophosphatase MutT (NUDIX family)
VEFGDSVEDTIRREVMEEYNVDVINFEFLGFRDVKRQSHGITTHWIALDFKVLVNPDNMKNNEPHKFDDIGWFSPQSMPEPVHSQFPNFLEKYKLKLK